MPWNCPSSARAIATGFRKLVGVTEIPLGRSCLLFRWLVASTREPLLCRQTRVRFFWTTVSRFWMTVSRGRARSLGLDAGLPLGTMRHLDAGKHSVTIDVMPPPGIFGVSGLCPRILGSETEEPMGG